MGKIAAAVAAALLAAIAWAAQPRDEPKADSRSDYLRTASVKPGAQTAQEKLGAVLDINLASKKELASLSGIGEDGAMKIMKGRPYKNKQQLLKRKILSPKIYGNLEDILVVR